MSLQDKLDAHRAEFQKKAPAAALKIMQQGTADLTASKIMDTVIKKGEKAPGFSLPDEKGQTIDSSQLLRKGPLVISFYRGVW